MSQMKYVIGILLLGCAFANAGCTAETTGDGSASGAGGIAGMLATGGSSGMVGTGGVSGMVASGGAGGMVASGGAGGTVATGGAGGMVATGGAGGMTATGGSGGMTATGGSGGMMGATSAVAMIMPFDTGTVTGTASFTQTGTDVTLILALANCPDGMHGVHIHQGTSCADAMMQGAHWDTTRGEGIPNVECVASTGSPPIFTRAATDPMLAWSIGGAAATNIVGHAIVVHGEGDPPARIGCGVIH